MIDFRGWASNLEWRDYFGDAPAWLPYILGIPAIPGMACVFLALPSSNMLLSLPIVALGVAILFEAFSREGFDQASLLFVSYEVSAIFAGILAFVGLQLEDTAMGQAFAAVAPALVFGFGPVTSRAISATFFPMRVVEFLEEKAELIRAAIAGEVDAIVVRVERVEGPDIDLATAGEAAGQDLVATLDVLGMKRAPPLTAHFLLEEPTLGERETSDYRGTSARRRVLATKKPHYLGLEPTAGRPSMFWDEVRAGIVMILTGHATLACAAWLIAGAIR